MYSSKKQDCRRRLSLETSCTGFVSPHSVPQGLAGGAARWLNASVSFGFLRRFRLPLSSDGVARLTGGVDYSGG